MAAEKTELVLGADISPLQRKLNEAKEDIKRFGTAGESSFSGMLGPLSALQSKFVAIGALLAGGAVFKEAIAETVKFTEESMKLGEALGISAGQASILREALEQGNTSQDEFVNAAKGLLKQVRENESGLNDMGLKTRDATGHLRPLNELTMDAIQVLNGYRAGTDRAIAGQVMFGKGFEMTSNLSRITNKDIAETQAQMESLGMVVSEESKAAWEEYDHSTDAANTTLKALKTTVGNVLMPVLSTLANWFVSIGPAAVMVIRGALGGLAAMFHFVTTGVTVLWETINAMVVTVAEPIRALGEAIGRALTGDFQGAADAIKGIGGTISNAWATAFDEMATKAQSTRDRIAAIFGEGTPAEDPSKAGKSSTGLLKNGASNGKKSTASKDPMDQSFLSTYEARLAEIKNAYEQEDGLRQFSKTQELAYWRELQQTYTLTSKDRLAVAKRTAMLELEIRREEAKEMRALDSLGVDAHRAAALGQLAADEQAAQFARENGQISKAQLIEIEEEFARRKFEIEYQSLLQRAELAKNDPTASPTALALLKEQMLQVERDYLLKKGELTQQKNKEGGMGGLFDDIGNSFGSGFAAILTKATTFRQQMANIFQGIYQSFVQNLIAKPVAEWIASNAKMLAIKLGFMAQEKAIQVAGSAGTVAIKAGETTAVAAGNAIQAGTGAAKSQAGIPIVGPILALAAMASVFAAVSSLGKGKSAMGGYDIPKGLNPLTQLHEEEMVLPQKYANVIRGFAAGGQSSDSAPSDGGAVNVHINTMDVKGVRDWLKSNPDALAPAMRRAARNYSPRSTTSALGKVF